MSDFTDCGFGAISPELLIRSLLSGINGRPACGIRVEDTSTTGQTMYVAETCGSAEDLMSLFQRALVMADDGHVAIRSTTTTAINGAGLSTCGNCASGYNVYEYLGSIFCQDASGNVYLNVINIT